MGVGQFTILVKTRSKCEDYGGGDERESRTAECSW